MTDSRIAFHLGEGPDTDGLNIGWKITDVLDWRKGSL